MSSQMLKDPSFSALYGDVLAFHAQLLISEAGTLYCRYVVLQWTYIFNLSCNLWHLLILFMCVNVYCTISLQT